MPYPIHDTDNPGARGGRLVDVERGVQVPATAVYWFAWAAFHPTTDLRSAPSRSPKGAAPRRRYEALAGRDARRHGVPTARLHEAP